MLISTSIFLFLDSSKVALDDSEFKITKAWVLPRNSSFPLAFFDWLLLRNGRWAFCALCGPY